MSYELYDGMPPHQETDTSYGAALSITGRVNALQEAILRQVRACGEHGSTDDELFLALAAHGPNTWRPRRRELVLKGYLADSGRRRPTTTGRPAIVWIAVTPGGSPEGHGTPKGVKGPD